MCVGGVVRSVAWAVLGSSLAAGPLVVPVVDLLLFFFLFFFVFRDDDEGSGPCAATEGAARDGGGAPPPPPRASSGLSAAAAEAEVADLGAAVLQEAADEAEPATRRTSGLARRARGKRAAATTGVEAGKPDPAPPRRSGRKRAKKASK